MSELMINDALISSHVFDRIYIWRLRRTTILCLSFFSIHANTAMALWQEHCRTGTQMGVADP